MSPSSVRTGKPSTKAGSTTSLVFSTAGIVLVGGIALVVLTTLTKASAPRQLLLNPSFYQRKPRKLPVARFYRNVLNCKILVIVIPPFILVSKLLFQPISVLDPQPCISRSKNGKRREAWAREVRSTWQKLSLCLIFLFYGRWQLAIFFLISAWLLLNQLLKYFYCGLVHCLCFLHRFCFR